MMYLQRIFTTATLRFSLLSFVSVSMVLCVLLFDSLSAQPRSMRGKRFKAKAYPVLDSAMKARILKAHNDDRARDGVEPLEWSDELSTYAQEWADYLATHGCQMKHRPGDGPYMQRHGENLYIATVYAYDPVDGVAAWYAEKKLYNGAPINDHNFHAVGHYTQMMWRGTKKVGAGIAVCNGNFILVCNYDPPGNVIGQTPF